MKKIRPHPTSPKGRRKSVTLNDKTGIFKFTLIDNGKYSLLSGLSSSPSGRLGGVYNSPRVIYSQAVIWWLLSC